MSRKAVFEEIAKIQRYYVPFRRHTIFVLNTDTYYDLLTNRDDSNDVNETDLP